MELVAPCEPCYDVLCVFVISVRNTASRGNYRRDMSVGGDVEFN